MRGEGARRSFVADRGDGGERLDLVVLRHLLDLPGASRTKAQEFIRAGLVTVDGEPSTRPSSKIRAGARIDVALPPAPPPRPAPVAQDIPLSVLYEDEDLMAIDKPPGLVVHPSAGHPDSTLVNALLHRAQSWAGPPDRPGLVHRLDKDTSGALVIAKTERALAGLAGAMKKRAPRKEYLAVVYGRAPLRKGRVDLRIRRHPGDRKRMATSKTEGRESSTLYEVLGESAGQKKGLSLLLCTLLTGRTHQIRAHLQAIRLPIVGDPVYGSPRWKGIADGALQEACRTFPRQALHAWRLAFDHPVTGRPLEVVAPVPGDIRRLLDRAGIAI